MTRDPIRQFLKHYLASTAYHAQKAIRGAPPEYWAFAPGNQVRTPEAILRHMTSVLGYARTFFVGGLYKPEPLPDIQAEIDRFHQIIEDVSELLDADYPLKEITELQLLQGPFSDVMTHIGQLSLLRRLCGSPVPPEDFVYADISTTRLGQDQPAPRRPDSDWPESPDLVQSPVSPVIRISFTPKVIPLKDVVEALEIQSQTMEQYLDRETGEILLVTEDDEMYLDTSDAEDLADISEWQRDNIAKLRAVLDTDRAVKLPSSFDIHEWEIMKRFSLDAANKRARQQLNDAIHGTGAFRMFHSTLDQLGLRNEWFAFRKAALEEIARQWLEQNEIPFA
jgi:hypothetical protein